MISKTNSLVAFAFTIVFLFSAANSVFAQQASTKKFSQEDKFRQLEEILPTPNSARAASGAPGSGYWQQKVDYEIEIRLDDEKQELFGKETITYTNNSKDKLTYVWLQLDANIHQADSDANMITTTESIPGMGFRTLKTILAKEVFDGSFHITRCDDSQTK
jgi:hypothetical protein